MEYIVSFDASNFSNLTEPPMAHVSASVGHYIFLVGGYRITNENDNRTIIAFDKNTLLYYDILNSQLNTIECTYNMESVGSFPTDFFLASGMACCSFDKRIYLFGGYSLTKQEAGNALYYIEISKNLESDKLNIANFSKIKPKASLTFLAGSYDGVDLNTHKNFPSYRDKASLVYWKNNLIVFGGYGSNFIRFDNFNQENNDIDGGHNFLADNGEYISGSGNRGWTNQLLIFSLEKNQWTNPATYGSVPCPRAAHSAAINGNKMFVFGGRLGVRNTSATIRSNEFFYLDLLTLHWTKINLSNTNIIGRSWTTLTVLNDNTFFIIGGFSGENVPLSDAYVVKFDDKSNVGNVSNKLHCFQHVDWDPFIDRNCWNTIDYFSPVSRMWHSACFAPDGFIYIIGGCRNNLISQVELIQTQMERIRAEPCRLYQICLWNIIKQKIVLKKIEIPDRLFNDILSLSI